MATNIEEGINICISQSNNSSTRFCSSPSVVTVAQKLIAEVIGTYFIIFAGCGSVAVNKLYDGSITFPGICVTWGLIVMVMIYSLGHVSGAHFNPAVTITFTIFRRFSWKLAPFYIIAQLTGSILASGTLTLLLDVTSKSYFGTIPIGSNAQSLAIEIIISFLLMFVVCGVCTDDRAIGHLGGLAIGMTIILNVFVAGIDASRILATWTCSTTLLKARVSASSSKDFKSLEDISGKGYLSWVLDAEIHLDAMGLADTIQEKNQASNQNRAKAMIFLRHHLDEGLKMEYLTVKDTLMLWTNLKDRYDHLKLVILPQRGKGRGPSRGRGRGRGRNFNHGDRLALNNNLHHQQCKKNDEKHEVVQKKNSDNKCYRCGGKGHWSRICRTPRHLVELYQAS
ncbi:hypothetical protein KY284_013317 [Solanum tuberosum]|nr:hypothetical protein KY284_013317 [Solanum tuberosum]